MTIFRCEICLLLLLGCSANKTADMSICSPLGEVTEVTMTSDNAEERASRCVQRNAYQLSVSQGANSEIANAALLACESEISMVGAEASSRGSDEITVARMRMASEWTEATRAELKDRAMLWVVQGRAGNCAEIFGDE